MNIMTRLTLFVLSVFAALVGKAQNLNGERIHVSSAQPVLLKFHSLVSNYEFESKEAEKQFEKKFIGDKGLQVLSVNPGFKPVKLLVIEGNNSHVFILTYKEVLADNESLHDYSNPKALKKKVDDLNTFNSRSQDQDVNARLAVDTVKQKPVAQPEIPVSKRTGIPVSEPAGNGPVKSPKEDTDSRYNGLVARADKAYTQNNLAEAAKLYDAALLVKPEAAYPATQLKKMEAAAAYDTYLRFMKAGKGAVDKQLYDTAEAAFREALKTRPNDPEANRELVKTGILKAAMRKKLEDGQRNRERETRYNDTIQMADDLYRSGRLAEAKIAYAQARKILPGDPYPAKKIASVDSTLALQKETAGKIAGKARADSLNALRLFKIDSLNTARYAAEVAKGDKYIETRDYGKAKAAFQLARQLKPEQTYPAAKLQLADSMLLKGDEGKKAEAARKHAADSISRQFTLAVKQGTAELNRGNHEAARTWYIKAKELKPEENFPATQLAVIDKAIEKKLAEQKYELFMHLGDSIAFIARNLRQALKWYDSARVVKPGELLPQKQINAVNRQIFTEDSIAANRESEKLRSGKYNDGMAAYNRGEAARLDRKYAEAYKGFAEFITHIDLANQGKYTAGQQHTIKQATGWLYDLRSYYDKDSIRQARQLDSLNNLNHRKRKKNKGTVQLFLSPHTAPGGIAGLSGAIFRRRQYGQNGSHATCCLLNGYGNTYPEPFS